MNQLSNDNSALIDRRVVVQLMVSYFERGHATEVLGVMERMLGFTEEDKERIDAARRRAGVLGRVASVPFAVLRGLAPRGAPAPPPGPVASRGDLAEAWVEFLIKQAEEMGSEEPPGGQSPGETAAPDADREGTRGGRASGELAAAPRQGSADGHFTSMSLDSPAVR
uniref:Golgin candidate 3-like n=2 Tax=Tetraselmis sp. GSL018 TaxID=582737 RepID=A0A061SNL4_9CHLO